MSAFPAPSPETSTAAQPSSTLVAHQPLRQPSGTAMGAGVTSSALVRPMRKACALRALARKAQHRRAGRERGEAHVEIARDQGLSEPAESPRSEPLAVDEKPGAAARGRPFHLTHGAAVLPDRARPAP